MTVASSPNPVPRQRDHPLARAAARGQPYLTYSHTAARQGEGDLVGRSEVKGPTDYRAISRPRRQSRPAPEWVRPAGGVRRTLTILVATAVKTARMTETVTVPAHALNVVRWVNQRAAQLRRGACGCAGISP